MIRQYQDFVKQNQQILKESRQFQPRNDKWVGTIDYAVARLNTAILRLINEPLELDSKHKDIKECQKAIHSFFSHMKNYYKWPIWMRWYNHIMIHYTGKVKIPRIKMLLNSLR